MPRGYIEVKVKDITRFKIKRVWVGRLLAHLYCLFHWKWEVCWVGDDENKPWEVHYIGCQDKDNTWRVFTYPFWLKLKKEVKCENSKSETEL